MDDREAASANGMVGCRRCGQSIEATEVLYSTEGEPICQACSVAVGPAVDLRQVRSICRGALITGLLSVVCNPLFVVSVIALVLSVRARRLLAQEAVRSGLGDRLRTMTTLSTVGGGLAVLGALLWLVLMPVLAFLYWFGQGMAHAL